MFYLFFVFFTEAVLPQLLYALCSGPETPIEHLERQQVRKKLKLNSIRPYTNMYKHYTLGTEERSPMWETGC